MRKKYLFFAALMMFFVCGDVQAESACQVLEDCTVVSGRLDLETDDFVQDQEMEAIKAFVERFYEEWGLEDMFDYDKVKPYITPNLVEFLADSYDFDCEGECLATWMFFYEGGGDVGELKSRQITARDKSHVLVEIKYENYQYAVLLTVIQDGETFKIDSLQQEKSEYIDME